MANDISTLTDLNGVTHDIKDSTARSAITTHASDTTIHVTAADKTAWNNKVDKETGKGLSTNDFTDALKTKLDGIASGAEVNVQSDWNEADSSADSYIQNKPNLSAVATSGAASDVSYDNTNSGMTADDVQEAVDELSSGLASHTGDTVIHVTATDKANWNGKITEPSGGTAGQVLKKTASGTEWGDTAGSASDITYDNTTSGLTATNVQDAIDESHSELITGLSSVEEEIDAINAATSIEDTEPYLFRQSAREDVVGNLMNVQKIIGGTVALNQLVKNELGATAWRVNSVDQCEINSFDADNHTINFTQKATSGRLVNTVVTQQNHVYFSYLKAKMPTISQMIVEFERGWQGKGFYLPADQTIAIKWIVKLTDAYGGSSRFQIHLNINDAPCEMSDVCIFDLTAMFGSAIADYIYSLEQSTAGAGVAFFRNLFPNDYYAYNAGELISVNTSAHVMRDANNNIIGNYALDPDLELRGIPKLDSNNNLYYDGDEYEPRGNVQRRYEKRAYQSGDESLADAITDGTNTVVKLATPTTETADPYIQWQTFNVNGTEEYVDTRAVPIPVGHDTFFAAPIVLRIDELEDEIIGMSENIAPIETSPATATHATGTYLVYQNRLYKVIASIAVGETLTAGTNIQATTIMEELLALTA